MDNSRRDVCNRGRDPLIGLDGASPHAHDPATHRQRAFAVLCGQYGDVTKLAQDREQSRQSLYREAQQVANAVDGAAAQARIDELQQQLAQRQAEVQALKERLEARRRDHPRQAARVRRRRPGRGGQPERGPAALAGRGGIATDPERADAGTGDPRGRHQGRRLCSKVLDEAARPEVKQGTADEIFLAANRS